MIGVLVRRGADFASAEDAVQEALVEAVACGRTTRRGTRRAGWSPSRGASSSTPRGPSSRRTGSCASRRAGAGPAEAADDTLRLYFLCAHPTLTPASAVALTLRAVGGLTTRQIAKAYLVPEATMAQRITRAKQPCRVRA